MVPKPFKEYYDGKCSHSTCQQRHCITQIRPNDQNKQTKARERLKAKDSNFGTYTYKQCFKISDFIIALSFKIKVFLMLMATHFYKMMF